MKQADFGGEVLMCAQSATMEMKVGDGAWLSGLPLGNGDVGCMLWESDGGLRLSLDKSDLWDTRMEWPEDPERNYVSMRKLAAAGDWERFQWLFEDSIRAENPILPTKLMFGRLELQFGDGMTACSGETALYRGVADVELCDGESTCRVTSFVSKARNVVCVRGDGARVSGRLLGLAESNEFLAELGDFSLERSVRCDGGETLVQSIEDGVSCAAAWSVLDGDTVLLALESAADAAEAREKAEKTLAEAREVGWDGLLAEHEAEWAEYWRVCGICVPDEKISHMWHIGMYLIASAAKEGCLPPGLQGVWSEDGKQPGWHGDYHADMNVQETFWPVYVNNHPELGRCLSDFLMECLPAAKKFCSDFFGWEGAFFPAAFMPGMAFVPGWSTVQFWMGCPAWLAHHMWMQWQYERDEKQLREQTVPFLREVFRFYDGLLEEWDDGRLHIPLSASPEMHDNRPEAWCHDPNCDLAGVRNLCRWVIETEKAAGDSECTERAEYVAEKLADYAVNERGGMMLWPGRAYDESHRHPSHIMSIHPYDDVNVDGGPEAQRIVEQSIAEYMELGMGRWAGHTYPQSLALAARAGKGNMAERQAHILHDTWLWNHSLHINNDFRHTGMSIFHTDVFTLETNCGIAGTIPEMLLQSWGGKLRLFPAIPDEWQDASFVGLRGEGGWVVSAQMAAGQVVAVRIEASVNGEFRLVNPFAGEWEATGDCADRLETCDDEIRMAMVAGTVIVLHAKNCGGSV